MGKLRIAIVLLLSGASLWAGGHEATQTDIVPRTVNFLIFAGLVYYLLADKTKAFFAQRSSKIASDFETIQSKIKDAKAELEAARVKLNEAKSLASELMDLAKKDAVQLSVKIDENAKLSCEKLRLDMSSEQQMARNTMVKGIIEDVVSDLVKEEGFGVSDQEFANILIRKAA